MMAFLRAVKISQKNVPSHQGAPHVCKLGELNLVQPFVPTSRA